MASTDWLTFGDGPIDWLSPTIDENPRAPAINVAIRHRVGQSVTLRVNGQRSSPLLFEGVQKSANRKWAVSHWRSVPLPHERTELVAQVVGANAEAVKSLSREVFFTTTPARAQLVPDRSVLVADGQSRPVIAVKMLDAAGRPIREGVSGTVNLSAPYLSADQIDQRQLDTTSRKGPSPARWRVAGQDGIALIELAPTMVSGSRTLEFPFSNGEITREQQLEAWIVPGDVEWTVIGLAEGSLGARSVADNMQREGRFDSDLGENARLALYAKGRILGRFLTTIAYDSAKQREDQRLLGTLDPDAYYTVFADASTRLFDAASREKLYLRIESANFFAVYGDIVTGFDQSRLSRYNRTLTGLQAEARLGDIEVQGFAAKVGSRLKRDEIQGAGISGPYTLSGRAIVPNSETIFIEVRDRFRPEVIIERRPLARFTDYEIDLLSGSIQFARPILSRTVDANPQFIIAEYEVEDISDGKLNAGIRAAWLSQNGAIQISATGFSDSSEEGRTHVAGVDFTAQVSASTQVQAEAAMSHRNGRTAQGWSVELDHTSSTIDARAYAQSLDRDFGIGQQNGVELGTRRIGADARIRLYDTIFAQASAWQADSLDDDRQRRAAQVTLNHRNQQRDLSIGLSRFDDRGAGGTQRASTTLELAGTQRFLNNRLELAASTSFALDNAQSVDLAARHRIGARYAVTDAVRVTGSYEIADSDTISSRTLRGGLEVSAWPGGQLAANAGQQDQAGIGVGSFAGLRLAQSLTLGSGFTLNATIDQNWGAIANDDPADLVQSAEQPIASGGQLGGGGLLLEDFTAVTLGAAWNRERWTINARGEYRDGELANRTGFTAGAIRQVGEGNMVGSGASWTKATGNNAASTEIFDAALAFAHRPDDRSIALLGKLEYRSDRVRFGEAGQASPIGRTVLSVDGDAISRRAIASLSADMIGLIDFVGFDEQHRRQSGMEFFTALRHNFDQIEGLDLATTNWFAGITPRVAVNRQWEIGLNANLRTTLGGGEIGYALGPFVAYNAAPGAVITFGNNIEGFTDKDFELVRPTRGGFYLYLRAKLDDELLESLGVR